MRYLLGSLFASILYVQSSFAQHTPGSTQDAAPTPSTEPRKELAKEVRDADTLSRDVFVEVEPEPQVIEPLQRFIVYPDIAVRSGIEGDVMLSMLIGKNGKVEKVEIDHADNTVFIDAVKEAAMKATYSPAVEHGKPV